VDGDERSTLENVGSDLAVNGNFTAGDTGWTKEAGWTIVDQGAGDYEAVATNVSLADQYIRPMRVL